MLEVDQTVELRGPVRKAPADSEQTLKLEARDPARFIAQRVHFNAENVQVGPPAGVLARLTGIHDRCRLSRELRPRRPQRERVRLRPKIVTTNEPIEAIQRQEEVALECTPVLTDVSATRVAPGDVDA